MTAITMLCTLCGAAALSRGVLRLLDAIDGEKRGQVPVDNRPACLYNIFNRKIQWYLIRYIM